MDSPIERGAVLTERVESRVDGKELGRQIEQRVFHETGETNILKEEERQKLRKRFAEMGVEVSGTRKVGGRLKEQAAEVVRLLGADVVNDLINEVLPVVIHEKGGRVYKKSDREAGIPEPSDERVTFFAHTIIDRVGREDFILAPKALAENISWKEATIYRVEALMSMAYQILRMCSYEDPVLAEAYQQGREMEKFRQRLVRGEIAHIGEDKAAKELLALKSDDIVRHAPSGSLGRVLEVMTSRRPATPKKAL